MIDFDVTAPATSFHVFACGTDFNAIRLGFANINRDRYRIGGVVAAATSSLSDCINPTGGGRWVPVTFASGGNDKDILVTSPDAPRSILAAGRRPAPPWAQHAPPAWTWTDWVPIRSLPRIDVPDGPRLLMVRVLLPGGGKVTQPNGGFGGYFGESSVNHGLEHGAGWLPSDFVGNPDQTVPNPAAARFGSSRATVACVQFLSVKPGLTGMTAGDSHHQGTSTTTQFSNYHLHATTELQARHAGRSAFGYVSTAYGGAGSEAFFENFLSLLPVIRPAYAFMPGWTFNDAVAERGDEEAMRQFLARLMLTADTCAANGTTPIFLTPFPRDAPSMGQTQRAGWELARKTILDMQQSGAVVLDAAALLGQRGPDGAFDVTYRQGMSDDTVHPNDAGHVAVGHAAAALIERIAGLTH